MAASCIAILPRLPRFYFSAFSAALFLPRGVSFAAAAWRCGGGNISESMAK